MIFAASGAIRPFNGQVARLLETELQGSLELGYKAPLDFELCGSLTSVLLALVELSYVALDELSYVALGKL